MSLRVASRPMSGSTATAGQSQLLGLAWEQELHGLWARPQNAAASQGPRGSSGRSAAQPGRRPPFLAARERAPHCCCRGSFEKAFVSF